MRPTWPAAVADGAIGPPPLATKSTTPVIWDCVEGVAVCVEVEPEMGCDEEGGCDEEAVVEEEADGVEAWLGRG